MSLIAHGAIESWPVLAANLRGLAYELAGYYDNETELCCPSNKTLAERLNAKPNTIQKWKKQLEDIGVISRIPRFVGGRETTSNVAFNYFQGGAS